MAEHHPSTRQGLLLDDLRLSLVSLMVTDICFIIYRLATIQRCPLDMGAQ